MTEERPPLGRRQAGLLIAALMLATALTALDVTIVGTALPTIVGSLGGAELYAWSVTTYLLTSTVTVPLYGRLADIYGRKPIFNVGIVIFLIGSLACGLAATMDQLIAFRAVQGVGAGALLPMGMTIIGDTFTVAERARVQAFLVSVWGTSSVLGPAAGAAIVSYLPWGWVFLINIPVGLIALAVLGANYHERVVRRNRSIDIAGVVTLSASVSLLMYAFEVGFRTEGMGLLALAGVLLLLFVAIERRASDPIVPMSILVRPVIGVGYLASVILGAVQFGVGSFVPLFVQGAMGGTAASVGAVVTPMAIGWPLGAIISGRLIVQHGYRRILIAGMAAVAVGSASLLRLNAQSSLVEVFVAVGVIGLGMGLTNPPIVIAFQNAVDWGQRGIVTSLGQFFRTIGGALVVALMGAILNLELAWRLGTDASADVGTLVSNLLDPVARGALAPGVAARAQEALAAALWDILLIPAALGVLGFILILRAFPAGSVTQLAATAQNDSSARTAG